MAGKKQKQNPINLESTRHKDTRTNNPEVGLVRGETLEEEESVQFKFDPNISPHLDWAGKEENVSIDVPLVSLHIHERIEPQNIIEGFRKEAERDKLFGGYDLPQEKAIEFYQHTNNWSNRLIAGDSLLVMNSLLHKENLAQSVKMVYVDPPYGIKYQSNFQPWVNRKPSKKGDTDENLTLEPNQIQAFRDTWELGMHSYLTYLRDRLKLAYELLHPQGSCFVQIGDENVDLVAGICAEIFGRDNRVATITVAKTSSSSSQTLPEVADYLIWYARDKSQMTFNQLYESLDRKEIVQHFSWGGAVELADGSCRRLTEAESIDPDKHLPAEATIFQTSRIDSMGVSTTGRSDSYLWNGTEYPCPKGSQWSVSKEGMDNLASQNRLVSIGREDKLYRKRYEHEVPGRQIHNIWWRQMYKRQKKYVVETSPKLAERCLLMSTNPGDLVLDPTCGSGTTAFVAETWGRRWITCDTSRVAINLAKQRLSTSSLSSFVLRDDNIGISAGYECKTVKTPSTRHLAYDEPQPETELVDQPIEKKGYARVSGPFTVEAVPAPIVENLGKNSTVMGGGG